MNLDYTRAVMNEDRVHFDYKHRIKLKDSPVVHATFGSFRLWCDRSAHGLLNEYEADETTEPVSCMACLATAT